MPVFRKDRKTTQVVCIFTKALSGSVANNAYFTVDWAAILKPNMPYYVHFTFFSNVVNYDGTRQILVWVDFDMLNYRILASNFNTVNSNIIGVIEPLVIRPNANNVHMLATTDTNCQSFMPQRPTNNRFNIRLYRQDMNNLWAPVSGSLPTEWVCTLHFTEAIDYKIYKEPKRIKQLALSSNYGVGTLANRTYNLNGFFERSEEYRISFTFVGNKPTIFNYGQPLMLFVSFNNEAYVPSDIPNQTTSKSGFLGFIARIRFDTTIDSSFMASNYLTNKPVNTRVSYNGYINVRFTDLNFTDTQYLQSPWILLLSFEEI